MLKNLEAAKNQAEEGVKYAVSKANTAMQNYGRQQGKPWDGRRVNDPRGREPDALTAVVRAFIHSKRSSCKIRSIVCSRDAYFI